VGMLIGALAALALVSTIGWEATVLIVCACSASVLFIAGVSESRSAS